MSLSKKQFNELSNGEKLKEMKKYRFIKKWWYDRPCKTCINATLYLEPNIHNKICMSCKKR